MSHNNKADNQIVDPDVKNAFIEEALELVEEIVAPLIRQNAVRHLRDVGEVPPPLVRQNAVNIYAYNFNNIDYNHQNVFHDPVIESEEDWAPPPLIRQNAVNIYAYNFNNAANDDYQNDPHYHFRVHEVSGHSGDFEFLQ